MGRVKEILPEGWTGPEYGQEPDEMECATDRYFSMLETYPASNIRTPQQSRDLEHARRDMLAERNRRLDAESIHGSA